MEKIIKNIIKGLNGNTIQIINFPVSYFNDTNHDNIHKLSDMFKFKIINNQKLDIDSAKISDKTIDEVHQIENDDYNKMNNIHFNIKNEFNQSLNFDNKYFDIKMYLDEDYKIVLQFYIKNNNNIYYFKFKNNLKKDGKTGFTSPSNIINYINIFINNETTNKNLIDFYNDFNIKKEKFIKFKEEFNTPSTNKLFDCVMIFILSSFKRFGDWYQQLIAKNTYFYVITNDFYAKLFGILNGSPVILDENGIYYLYNFLPLNYNKYIEINKLNILIHRKSNYDRQNKLYTGKQNKNKEIPYDRSYFRKYLKYKNKYYNLKIN